MLLAFSNGTLGTQATTDAPVERLPAAELGGLSAQLLVLDGKRTLASGPSSMALVDVTNRQTLARAGGGQRVALSSDKSSIVRHAHHVVTLHPTWLLPLTGRLPGLGLDRSCVDIGLTANDRLVTASREGEVRIIDLVTLEIVVHANPGRAIRCIAVRGDRKVRIGVGFMDGSAAEVVLETSPGTSVSEHLQTRWNPALDAIVRRELERNLFVPYGGPVELESPRGRLTIARRRANCWRGRPEFRSRATHPVCGRRWMVWPPSTNRSLRH